MGIDTLQSMRAMIDGFIELTARIQRLPSPRHHLFLHIARCPARLLTTFDTQYLLKSYTPQLDGTSPVYLSLARLVVTNLSRMT